MTGQWAYLLPWVPYIQEFVSRVNRLPIQGMTVTSWWRDPPRNRLAKGHPESQHLFALGVDVAGTRAKRNAILEQARFQGLIAVDNPGKAIVHIQAFPAGALRRAGVTFPT